MDRIFPIVFLGVVLTLLVIVTVMLNPGCGANYVILPVTCNPSAFPNAGKIPKVVIKRDGSTYFDQNILDVNSLQGLISNHSQKVVIAADTRLAYKDVKKTLELLSIFGVSDFVLLSERAKR